MDDLIKRSDAIKAVTDLIVEDESRHLNDLEYGFNQGVSHAVSVLEDLPSADRPKHYCAECKYEPIDKRCMPCSSCTNNPKNRDAFVSCEVEKKGTDDE